MSARDVDTTDYWLALEKEMNTQKLRENPQMLEELAKPHDHGGHFVLSDATRAAREAAISGLSGGSLFEAVLPVLLVPASLFAMANVYAWWKLYTSDAGSLPTTSSLASVASSSSSSLTVRGVDAPAYSRPPSAGGGEDQQSGGGEPRQQQQQQQQSQRRRRRRRGVGSSGGGGGGGGGSSLPPREAAAAAAAEAAAQRRLALEQRHPYLRLDAPPCLPLAWEAAMLVAPLLLVLTSPSRGVLPPALLLLMLAVGAGSFAQVQEFKDPDHASAWRHQKLLNLANYHHDLKKSGGGGGGRSGGGKDDGDDRSHHHHHLDGQEELEEEFAAQRRAHGRASSSEGEDLLRRRHRGELELFDAPWPRYLAWWFSASCRRSNAADRRGLAFLSNFRGAVVLVTCVCILAVDFPACFDPRYAKTERFGVSLMDLGTGLFVYSSGLCSRWARHAALPEGERRRQRDRASLGFWSSSSSRSSRYGGLFGGGVWRGVLEEARKHASVAGVLALGLARCAVLCGLNYQVHASEYGLHWNFFLTLAAVWALVGALRRACGGCTAAARWLLLLLRRRRHGHGWQFFQGGGGGGGEDDDDEEEEDKRGGRSHRPSLWSEVGSSPTFTVPAALLLLAAYQASLVAHRGRLTTWIFTAERGQGGEFLAVMADAFARPTTTTTTTTTTTSIAARATKGVADAWRVFFAANREGILGVVPHAALYLAAEAIGRRAIWIPTAASRRRVAKHWSYRALGLAALSLAFWGAWAAAAAGGASGQATSRRLCNAPYVLLLLAVATTALAAFLALDLFACSLVPASRALEALSRRQLTAFLAANALTGAANVALPWDTLDVGRGAAKLVIALHTAAFVAIPMLVDAVAARRRYARLRRESDRRAKKVGY